MEVQCNRPVKGSISLGLVLNIHLVDWTITNDDMEVTTRDSVNLWYLWTQQPHVLFHTTLCLKAVQLWTCDSYG